MLRIPWTAHRTNISILNELEIKDRLSTICRRGILRYFGHITRRDHNNLERLIVQGRIEGRRPRGRSPSRWIYQIKEITGKSIQVNARETEDKVGDAKSSNTHNHGITTLLTRRYD
ncbi:endonuclease-reverse transcriptase [Lasius niger]|uniref:Endonuclease-reverse transcriptase n=1 Tax=Lasius niger TaxID=67767 RepID=A0A0J7JU58_LASNI|nr:endonuclease-reverse transcriptase [Lasius niger]